MAHYKRKRARTQGSGHYSNNGYRHRFGMSEEEFDGSRMLRAWYRNYPRYWDKVFHTRPARRKTRQLEQKVLHGEDPDNMTWPDGRKPHIYYW